MPRKQKEYHYIYKTTNIINGQYYIGMHSTNNLEDGYIGSGKRLWYSIKKYGRENFKCEIVEMLPNRDLLKQKESEIVCDKLLEDKMCLNLKNGGEGGFSSEEHRKKFLEAAKKTNLISLQNGHKTQSFLWKNDKKWIEEQRKIRSLCAKGNKSFTGRTHKTQSKIKIGQANSITQKGAKNSQYGTFWITNGSESKKNKIGEDIPIGWYKGRINPKKKKKKSLI
jgi:hypothetical protein